KDVKPLPGPCYGDVEHAVLFLQALRVMRRVAGGKDPVDGADEKDVAPFETFCRVDRGEYERSLPDRVVKILHASLRRLHRKVDQEAPDGGVSFRYLRD